MGNYNSGDRVVIAYNGKEAITTLICKPSDHSEDFAKDLWITMPDDQIGYVTDKLYATKYLLDKKYIGKHHRDLYEKEIIRFAGKRYCKKCEDIA